MANQRSKMVIRGKNYYKYVSIWNPHTKKTKQIPIKLAHVDEFKKADYRKGVVERKALELKREGKLELISEYDFGWRFYRYSRPRQKSRI